MTTTMPAASAPRRIPMIDFNERRLRDPALQAQDRMAELRLPERHRLVRDRQRPQRVSHCQQALNQPTPDNRPIGKALHAVVQEWDRLSATPLHSQDLPELLVQLGVPLIELEAASGRPLGLWIPARGGIVDRGDEVGAIGARSVPLKLAEEHLLGTPNRLPACAQDSARQDQRPPPPWSVVMSQEQLHGPAEGKHRPHAG